MIREGSRWRTVTWNEAIAFTAGRMKRLMGSIGVLGSARATNEENYLAQKFARAVLGTNNVDCCARVCHAPSAAALKLMLGTGAATNSFDDIEQARTILVCGSNATENHPIVGARIKQQALRGANLIVIDPRRIELADHATLHLPLRLGTNVPLFNAMASTIVEEGLFDKDFLETRVSEWEEFRDFIRSWLPERVSGICGVKAEPIRRAARLYATAKPAMSVHGLGMTEHTQGTESVMALINLALLTGNLGKPGTGVNPLRGQNNVQGSAHMGCEPDHLTGYVPLSKERERFEGVWKTSIPTEKGLNLLGMMEAARAGTLKGLWAIGYDILLTNPDAAKTREALRSLELLVVQDMFLNETARECGSVFLPVASAFEKDGTFMNGERRIQRVRKVIDPVGESKPDGEVITALARAMGKGEFFDFRSPREIWEEIRKVWVAGSGITYERLEKGGVQWPCPSEGHPGSQILHRDTFPIGPRAALRRISYTPTAEMPTEEFPFLLTTGRNLYQFNAGTMTLRTPNRVLRETDLLDVSPEDAGRLGLQGGDRVRLSSRHGEAELEVSIHPNVKQGELFTTFNTAEVFINNVTGPFQDPYTQTPEYKVTAVRIEKVRQATVRKGS
jgi:formate dehydrogenase major subunit